MRYEGSSSIVDVQSRTRVNVLLGYGGVPRIGHEGTAILNRVFPQDGQKPCTVYVSQCGERFGGY